MVIQIFLFLLIKKYNLNKTDTYEFRVTSANGNYWQSREECINMGGDLLMHNFGEEGSQYFKLGKNNLFLFQTKFSEYFFVIFNKTNKIYFFITNYY